MYNRLPSTFIGLLPILVMSFIICSISISQTSDYNFYYGNLHSHTWYSDGNQDKDTNTYKQPVAKAIEYGRTVANNLNILAITDHNHNEGLNMTMARWRAGYIEADTANKDGIFVGLYGQEWGTLSTGGHVLIFGTNKLFGWNTNLYDVYVAKGDYASLWNKVNQNGGFCYLAHPSNSDFGNLISNSYNAFSDSLIQGTAVKNGPAFSTNMTQTDPASGNYESYYHSLLKLGYHVAPTADQDNHNTNFGMSNQQRSVVLAQSLTRTDILTALKNRNVYASEDNNVKVKFEVGNYLMGDIFSFGSPFIIKVKITDSTPNDLVSKIEIRYGIPGSGANPQVLTSVNNIDSLSYTVTQPIGTTYYYYIYVQQADGHKVWTAPMWITAETPLPVTFGSFNLNINPNGGGVLVNWITISEINNNGFYVQRKKEGDTAFVNINSEIIPGAGYSLEPKSYSFNDTTIIETGLYYYRILQLDSNGLEHYSAIDSIHYSPLDVNDGIRIPLSFQLGQNYPNPFNPSTTINYSIADKGFVALKVFDVLGNEIEVLVNEEKSAGYYKINFNASHLSSGVYFYRMQTGKFNEVKKFLFLK